MSVQYAHARDGYKYQITYAGRKVKSIMAKYKDNAKLFKQYQYHVPKTWVTNGYVEEVKEDEEV